MKLISAIGFLALIGQARRHLDDPTANGKRHAVENIDHPDV